MINPLNILVVDDDPDDQFLFREALEYVDSNALLQFAFNGVEALEAIDTEKRPDYVFLDLNMPVMDGVECLAQLKKLDFFDSFKVIIYSTSIDPKVAVQCKSNGAASVIQKPNDFLKLCSILANVLINPNSSKAN